MACVPAVITKFCWPGTCLARLEHWAFPVQERPLLCLLAGLVGSAVWEAAWAAWAGLWGATLLGVGLLLALPWRTSPSLQKCCRWFWLGVCGTVLHLWWQAQPLPPSHIVHYVTGHTPPVTIVGVVDRALETRAEHQYLYLQVQHLQDQQGWHAVRGLIRLNVHTTSLTFLPGDVLRVLRVRLHRVHSLANPGGFDFERFMQQRGIYVIGGVSNATRVHLQEQPQGISLPRLLEQWRRHLRASVLAHLPAPYAGVFLAMIVGQRGDLPTTIQQAFRDAGVSHLLVVSGLNVSFIAVSVFVTWRFGLRWLRSILPRTTLPGWRPTPWAAALSLPAVLLYCSLVGWEVPTTRAAVMVSCYLLTLLLDRGHDVWHAMVLAAVTILLWDPLAIFDVSLQLSFVAVIAMLLGSTVLPSRQGEHSRWRSWRHHGQIYLVVNSAAYVGTLPILASAFHTVQVYGLVANVPLVLLAGLFTPVGVFALCAVMLWPALAPVTFGLLKLPLLWIVAMTEAVARWPGAQLHLAAPSWGMVVGYYGMLGLFMRRWPGRWRVACCCSGLLLVLGGSLWQYLETRVRQLHVTFLDVGTGDAIFVQAPGNHHLLIDGGGTYDGRFDIGAQVIAPVLWQRYVRRFDLLALTHTHPNHARGLVSVLRLFPAQHLLTNGTPLQADYLRALVSAGQSWRTQHHTAVDGPRQWQWGGLHVTVIAPPTLLEQERTGWAPRTENDRSLVLHLQYGSTRVLLTGDIEHSTERWLATHHPDLRADILQIPHHGSKTSTSPDFVKQIQPAVGVISVGADNPYGHPHRRVLEVLAAQQIQVWRTDVHGAVTITSDGTRYQVVPFRPYRPREEERGRQRENESTREQGLEQKSD